MKKAVEELAVSLKSSFQGELLQTGRRGFDEARVVWNAMVARTPALIARCADTSDVQTVVRAAAAAGILTAVRCGGHSLAGFSTCEGGLVIDLTRMRHVTVDEKNRRAHAEGGCLLASIDSVTQRAGLVFPAGVVSHTGAGGLILGGGTGWLTRMFGMSCDNVARFTLVAADGSIVHASAKENTELYWALRGGGGNFGVVTQFELQLHPLTSVLLAGGFCGKDDIFAVLQFWRHFMPGAPDELKWNLSLRLAPELPAIPAALRGRPVLSQSLLWSGDHAKGLQLVDNIFSVGNPRGVTKDILPYLTLQTMADAEFPHGRRYYTKSGYFQFLGDDSITHMVNSLSTVPSANTQIELAYLGGAAGRVAASETAFGDRSAPFIVNLLADWSRPEDDAVNIAWVRELFGKLRPAMKPGVYVNFMSGDEKDRVHEAYHERWDRIVAVKSHYDPKNFFRLNQNVPPVYAPGKG
jgi:FAD binding domain/Berberine and berberine like